MHSCKVTLHRDDATARPAPGHSDCCWYYPGDTRTRHATRDTHGGGEHAGLSGGAVDRRDATELTSSRPHAPHRTGAHAPPPPQPAGWTGEWSPYQWVGQDLLLRALEGLTRGVFRRATLINNADVAEKVLK